MTQGGIRKKSRERMIHFPKLVQNHTHHQIFSIFWIFSTKIFDTHPYFFRLSHFFQKKITPTPTPMFVYVWTYMQFRKHEQVITIILCHECQMIGYSVHVYVLYVCSYGLPTRWVACLGHKSCDFHSRGTDWADVPEPTVIMTCIKEVSLHNSKLWLLYIHRHGIRVI